MHCCAFKALWMSWLQNFQLIFLHRSVLDSHHEQHCWRLQTIQHTHTLTHPHPCLLNGGKFDELFLSIFFFFFAKSSGFLMIPCRWGWSDHAEICAGEGQRSVKEYTGINDVMGWKRWRFGLFFLVELKWSTPLRANCSFGSFEDNKWDF